MDVSCERKPVSIPLRYADNLTPAAVLQLVIKVSIPLRYADNFARVLPGLPPSHVSIPLRYADNRSPLI